MRACRKCHMITTSGTCPYCEEATTEHWTGYLVLVDPTKSEIGEKMKLKMKGKYALKVR